MDKHFTLPYDGGLVEENLSPDILHAFEKIPAHIHPDSAGVVGAVADIVVRAIRERSGGTFRLGFSSGNTTLSLLPELVRRYRAGEVSFRSVEVVCIDEYYPLERGAGMARNHAVFDTLVEGTDLDASRVYTPASEARSGEEIADFCARYDALAKGLDLLVLGMGKQGQVGFNESGSGLKSRTRVVRLSYASRKRQAKYFNRDLAATPDKAITVGIGTMLSARRIVLLAWGESKANALRTVVEDTPSVDCPASLLQSHERIAFYADESAASLLTRLTAPWMVGSCDWKPKFIRKAVVWLCQRVGKPILKLTENDYLNNSLSELLEHFGPFDKINIDVFNDLQHTITGWPGGKPGVDDSTRPVSATPYPKTVLIFSPHPDDDVISMGGTFIRLVSQGHHVHVAYETSGNVAVHDDVVLQHMDTARQLGFGDHFDEARHLVESKRPGEPEPRELLDIKGGIRRAEARAAVRSFGLDDNTNVHFLNLPFYESGGIEKRPRTQVDVDIIKELLRTLKPHMVFMAGDLADPHGTHRVCTEAALEALDQLRREEAQWLSQTQVWLYRGAWMEWELGRVDMAVPLSPDEVVKKRHAIFRHISQKDIVPFPGEDTREFWQRAEERTQHTAQMYDKLGMAEYQAIEVFLRLY